MVDKIVRLTGRRMDLGLVPQTASVRPGEVLQSVALVCRLLEENGLKVSIPAGS